LQDGDELVLNGLLGQAAPAGALEAVLGGGLGKVALLETLPALAIASRRRPVGLAARPLQEVVARITIETAPGLGTGALRSQVAAPAHSRSCSIVIVTAMAVEVMLVKGAARGTLISVAKHPAQGSRGRPRAVGVRAAFLHSNGWHLRV